MTHALRLDGIRPEPLAGYLKGVALLRVIGEQADPTATGAWEQDAFVLRSRLDRETLLDFLLDDWAPTPLVAPWNGGSGFNARDQQSGIDAIERSTLPRFATYRHAISVGRRVLAEVGDEDKALLIRTLRGMLPDAGIRWLDGAVVLTSDTVRYPPLLGTGGNDGRLEFSNNQMQRLVELLIAPKDPAVVRSQLSAALFGDHALRERDANIGQFAPGQAGGANTGMGFRRDALINPWDFVLALEGALTFAASVNRALDDSTSAAFPFFVRSTPAGYASSSDDEESRGELWMPLWTHPATYGEISALVTEGRAWVGLRPAATGTDFARAIRQLGIARGVDEFQRFTLAQRNGLAFFATSAGRYRVSDAPIGDPISSVDGWLERLRQIARGKIELPARVLSALRSLDTAILRPGDSATADERLLLALGSLSSAVVQSRRHRAFEYLPPMPATAPGSWSRLSGSANPVWRAAFILSGGGFRYECQPVGRGAPARWSDLTREAEVSPSVAAIERLLRVGFRRLHRPEAEYVIRGGGEATLNDLLAIVSEDLDENALGLALDASSITQETVIAVDTDAFAGRPIPLGLALCAAALHGPPNQHDPWPIPGPMLEALARGAGEGAILFAKRHLQAREVPTLLPVAAIARGDARRIGAALLLPLAASTHRALWRAISLATARTIS